MNPNTEIPKKHVSCPNCNEPFTAAEIDAQECWACKWPYNDGETNDNGSAKSRNETLTAREVQKYYE